MDLIITLAIYGFLAYCISTVCAKAGFNTTLGILAFIPIANILLLYYIAYARWPRFDD